MLIAVLCSFILLLQRFFDLPSSPHGDVAVEHGDNLAVPARGKGLVTSLGVDARVSGSLFPCCKEGRVDARGWLRVWMWKAK